jgi:FkbM family methyltransferase
VDCGAAAGDTVMAFTQKYGDYGHILAFEPGSKSYARLVRNVANLLNITTVNKGCSDCKATLTFEEDDDRPTANKISENGNTTIEVDKIDNFTTGLPPVGLIKMDIEGAELAALEGAAGTIRRDKPVLAICAYHKPEDLITIPQYLKSLVPEYRLFLRCCDETPVALVEFCLYAVCENDFRR